MRYLKIFRQIGIVIVLPVEFNERLYSAIQGQRDPDRGTKGLFVQDWQATRETETDRTDLRIGALPEFRRSTVDGYAVRSTSTPGVMRVVGEVRMGEVAGVHVNVGEAALVHTGGYVPEGADAVVMLEQTLPLDVHTTRVQTRSRLMSGENVIQAGEDVRAGEVVVHAGTRLREQELAGLLSLGITKVTVVRRPRVALIASGA